MGFLEIFYHIIVLFEVFATWHVIRLRRQNSKMCWKIVKKWIFLVRSRWRKTPFCFKNNEYFDNFYHIMVMSWRFFDVVCYQTTSTKLQNVMEIVKKLPFSVRSRWRKTPFCFKNNENFDNFHHIMVISWCFNDVAYHENTSLKTKMW